VAGGRAYFLQGMGCFLNQALINYGLQFLEKKAYTAMHCPFFIRQSMMGLAAQLEDFDEQLYKVGQSGLSVGQSGGQSGWQEGRRAGGLAGGQAVRCALCRRLVSSDNRGRDTSATRGLWSCLQTLSRATRSRAYSFIHSCFMSLALPFTTHFASHHGIP
jgi:hypothetical protein